MKKKISKIEYAVRKDAVYDIETPTHDYILANGVISHNTMEMFSKQIVSGGKGIMYGSNAIWMMGRRQEKQGTEVIGYSFTINIEKSRFVREKSKIPITVTYEGGLSSYSGLIDIAKEGEYVISPKQGWYCGKDDIHAKNYRLKETNSAEFWDPIFEGTDFAEYIEKRYALGQINLMDDNPGDSDDDGNWEYVVEEE